MRSSIRDRITFSANSWPFSVLLFAVLAASIPSQTLLADPFTVTVPASLQDADNGLLTRVLEFSTDNPTKARFLLEGGGEQWFVESLELSTEHRIPVMGMKFSNSYTVKRIKLEDGDGTKLSLGDEFNFSTASQPAGIHNISVLTSDLNEMEPGWTMFTNPGNTIAIDAAGEIRWHYRGGVSDIRRISNGNFLGRVDSTLREFDITGRTVRDWYASGSPPDPSQVSPNVAIVNANDFHHDSWYRESNGNIFTIERRLKTVFDYPQTEDPNGPIGEYQLRYDAILEFDTAGNIVQEWDLTDILDIDRRGYGVYSQADVANWSHSNAVYHDTTDDSIVVSSRHQDAVIKFDRVTGDLKWILGNHENWGPAHQPFLLDPISGPGETFEWQYHQHAPMLLANGNIMLYDNGNYRASPFDPPLPDTQNYSRAVEYQIDDSDPNNMTVTQVWSYGKDADEIFFSRALGDADVLPLTDNVLLTNGFIEVIDGVSVSPRTTRIVEVTRDGEVVFDVHTTSPTGGNATVYRSERLHLYDPALFTVTAVPSPSSGALALVACLQWACRRRRVVKPAA